MELRTMRSDDFPPLLHPLREVPQPPAKLFMSGTLPPEGTVLIAVVGSRKHTPYGKEACEHIIRGLAGYPVAIVSGLALGLDSVAHRAALDAGIPTIAVPGSGLSEEVIYPREHVHLSREIIEKGGSLISPKRNRIMSGLARLLVVVEAELRSGSLITARLSLDYGRDVAVVPGSIFSDSSKGTHYLLRHGATPVTSAEDILEMLGFEQEMHDASAALEGATDEERLVIAALREPMTREELGRSLGLSAPSLAVALSVLEIKGLIAEEGGRVRKR
ncbi:DNA-protecting protein DprA [Candidatus Parcubacteria bacterium]|nr:DNA-protecting protein DprA [Candidatus Parcubacteria bacterium]